MDTLVFTVPDLCTEHDKEVIVRVLEPMPGVDTVAVDLDRKRLQVTHDPASVTRSGIVQQLALEGYPVE